MRYDSVEVTKLRGMLATQRDELADLKAINKELLTAAKEIEDQFNKFNPHASAEVSKIWESPRGRLRAAIAKAEAR